jgi:glucan-binding YG repeat protein
MQSFKYDPNGNMTLHYKPEAQTHYYWDEANRMRVVQQEDQMHHYIYDAAGERVLKSKTNIQEVYENGTLMSSTAEIENYTTYPSPLLTINPEGNYTKHYFAGTQRIASKTMAQSIDNNLPQTPENPSLQQQQQAQQTDLENYLKQANIKKQIEWWVDFYFQRVKTLCHPKIAPTEFLLPLFKRYT